MEGIFPVFSRQNPDYKSNKKNRDRMFWGRKQAEISADDLIQMCMQQNTKHRFTNRDISYCENSPFYLYCNRFVDPIHRDDQCRNSQGIIVKHENKSFQEPVQDTEKKVIPEEIFGQGIKSVIKGKRKIQDTLLFYLPDGMCGRPDQLIRTNGESIFGKHHYVVKKVKLQKGIERSKVIPMAFYTILLERSKITRRTHFTYKPGIK